MTPSEERLASLRADALAIFEGALAACEIEQAFARRVAFQDRVLLMRQSPQLAPIEHSFAGIRKVVVIAFGKAALPMLDALLTRLPEKLRVEGVCSGSTLPEKRRRHIRYFSGSHPLPNEASLDAAEAALHLLRRAGKDTFVFFLVSGGGSSMLEQARDPAIPLEDMRAFYETLVHSGATITEINTVRKYFSAVKGGRLALAAPLARKLTLLLADVPMKDLALVASSPTLPDHSTWAECAAILEKWELIARFPATVRAYFQAMAAQPPGPTPEAIPNNDMEVLLSSHDLVTAARDHARGLGYRVLIDEACDDWPYDRASAYLLDRFRSSRTGGTPLCLLSSGEVTVPMEGMRAGCGGRNQQFVLDAALRIEGEGAPLVVLSAGSDGVDGNSPAAGAVADPTTVERARRFHFDPAQNLARYNSCPLFTALGDAVVTGPTGNNLRDLRILLSAD